MKKLLGAATLLTLAVGASPTMAQVGSGIYLRADAGAGLATDMKLEDTDASNPSSTLGGITYTGDTVKSVLASAGIGYRLSPVFRIDLTASYLPGLRFNGGDNAGLGTIANAKIKPRFALVNGYVDFGTLAGMPATGVQPFLVASLGASRNQIGDISLIGGSGTFLDGQRQDQDGHGLGPRRRHRFSARPLHHVRPDVQISGPRQGGYIEPDRALAASPRKARPSRRRCTSIPSRPHSALASSPSARRTRAQ